MPKVSVIIPTFNRAKFVREAVESIYAQTFRDFEVIVIDDGSTDNTAEVLSSFPVKYFWQENQGPQAALNKGNALATGEYLCGPGSDDAMTPGAMEKGVNILDNHPEVAFSYGQAYLINEAGHIFGLERPHVKKSCIRPGWEELRDYLIYGNHVTASTIMVRRRCVEEAGGHAAAFRAGSEDLDLWTRIAGESHVAYIAEPLAKLREHSGKFSNRRSLDEWEKTNGRIIEAVLRHPQLASHASSLRGKAYFRLGLEMAGRYHGRGDMSGARKCLLRALRFDWRAVFSTRGLFWMLEFGKTLMPKTLVDFGRAVKRLIRGRALQWVHRSQ